MKRTWQKPEIFLLNASVIESGSIYIMGSEGQTMNFMQQVMTAVGPCYTLTLSIANAEMNTMNATLFLCS